MSRHLAMCTAVTCLLLAASGNGLAQRVLECPVPGVRSPGRLIVFDADSALFDPDASRDLSASESVTVVLKNVNTFTHKYAIICQTTDYHNLSVPSALGELISTRPPTVATRGMLEEEGLPEWAQCDIRRIRATAKDLASEVADSCCDHLGQVVNIVRTGRTNEAIRRGVVVYVHERVIGTGCGCDLDNAKARVEALVPKDGIGRDEIDNVAAFEAEKPDIDLIAGLIAEGTRQKILAFKCAVDQWARDYTDPPEAAGDLSGTDKQVRDFAKAVLDRAEPILRDRTIVANVYRTMLDPILVPTKLTKSLGTINADSLDVKVQVDRIVPPYAAIDPFPSQPPNPLNTIATPEASVSSRTYSVSAPVYRRWVLDFAAGIGTTTLVQHNYYVGADIVRMGTSDSANIAATVLAQVYMTSKRFMGLTVGPCVGIVTADPIRYVAGGSVIVRLSDRVRLSYSYGLAWGKVNDLNGEIVGSPPLDTTVSTAQHTKQGYFQAVTFAFSF